MEGFDSFIFIVHMIVGFALVYFAIKAYKRTRYVPMILLAVGFTLLVLGETLTEYIFPDLENGEYSKYIDELFEIVGFLVLIWAVKKS